MKLLSTLFLFNPKYLIVLILKISPLFMKTPDVPCGMFAQLRPAAPLKMEMSLFTAPLATSATSSTQETPLPASLTGDSALSNVAILVRQQRSW